MDGFHCGFASDGNSAVFVQFSKQDYLLIGSFDRYRKVQAIERFEKRPVAMEINSFDFPASKQGPNAFQ